MKKKLLAILSAASIIQALPLTAIAAENDSGIDYTEAVRTINNPACGYSTTVWAVCKPNETPVYNPTGNLMLFFIDIGNFSSGANADGKDYDLDDAFFSAWDETLSNCRDNGCMVSLRFRYDANGKDNPEPETFEQVLAHIQQVKESGLLEKYADILAFVESGFVGKWGEQHGGKYTSVKYKAQLLQALLDAVPSPVPVTVRTPDIFAEWAGIKRSELADTELLASLTSSDYCPDIQAYRSRIGLYDDGYMGSNSDLGTYADREIETAWLGNQTFTSYFGGEFSGNIDFAKQYETYLPQNAIPEMYNTHLSYINSNIFSLYKDYTYSEDYATAADTSAYYGQTVYQFIRDHIGYRFVLRRSELPESACQGGKAEVGFDVENTGFAGLIPHAYSYVILEKDGVFTIAEADINCNDWLSCSTSGETLSFDIPDNIDTGDWNVYLKLNVGTEADIMNMNSRSIQFANDGVWNGSLGANYLGSIKISEAEKKSSGNSSFYRAGNDVVVDGLLSSPYEWQNAEPMEDNGLEMRTYADDKYLYVMCNMPKNNASAPVYNLQLNNPEDDSRYWIYFQSNGFVYFNHDDYSGSQCKWSDDMVEFRLPFDKFNLRSGLDIENLRVFMQDSGNDWQLMGDMKIPECKISSDIGILSAYNEVTLDSGEDYEYTLISKVSDGLGYRWYKDGEALDADSPKIRLESVSEADSGLYTVEITSESGSRTFEAFRLTVASESEYLAGDANCDGEVNIADATAIIQHIGNKDRYGLSEQGLINADIDGSDGVTGLDAMMIQKYEAGIIQNF